MKIVYLHGLRSSPKSEKVDFLRSLGHNVYNPLIDYQDYNIYFNMEKEIKKFNPDWIIGSSMGGYLGYHYARVFNIRALLFNPAFKIMDNEKSYITNIKTPDLNQKYFPLIEIHLGKNDDIVDKDVTENFIQKNLPKYSYNIISHNFGHRIPLDSFKNIVNKTG